MALTQQPEVRPIEQLCFIVRGKTGPQRGIDSLGHYEDGATPTALHLRAHTGGVIRERCHDLIHDHLWKTGIDPYDLGRRAVEEMVDQAVWMVHYGDSLPDEAARMQVRRLLKERGDDE